MNTYTIINIEIHSSHKRYSEFIKCRVRTRSEIIKTQPEIEAGLKPGQHRKKLTLTQLYPLVGSGSFRIG